MLQAKSISSNIVGRGIKRVAKITTRPITKTILLWEVRGGLSGFPFADFRKLGPSDSDEFNLSDTAIIIFSLKHPLVLQVVQHQMSIGSRLFGAG
jgi:hypothetical protein